MPELVLRRTERLNHPVGQIARRMASVKSQRGKLKPFYGYGRRESCARLVFETRARAHSSGTGALDLAGFSTTVERVPTVTGSDRRAAAVVSETV